MQFNINDKVEVIDEAVKGTIVSINRDNITILTEEGFEMEVRSNEITKTGHLAISNVEVSKVLREKGDFVGKDRLKKTAKNQGNLPLEVDLHIYKLVDSTKGMTNYDMLTLQLATAERILTTAIKKRLRRIVFIHGVGAGILKAELEALFDTYEGITYYDANYKKYGSGATEVYIHQNRR